MAKELYVGHISDNASEEDVYKLFSVMGTVSSVHLIVDPETNEFKHCGYVRMPGANLQQVADELDGALLIDRVITVSIARPQKPGMSKSGRSGKFGGPRKPGLGAKASSAPKAPGNSKEPGNPKARPERKSGDGLKPRSGATMNVAPKSSSRPTQGTEQKTGRGAKPAGRPQRRTGRTGRPK